MRWHNSDGTRTAVSKFSKNAETVLLFRSLTAQRKLYVQVMDSCGSHNEYAQAQQNMIEYVLFDFFRPVLCPHCRNCLYFKANNVQGRSGSCQLDDYSKNGSNQTNDYDCGVPVCNFVKCLIHNMFPCYDQSFITYFRQYMARELVVGCCFPCPLPVARESPKQPSIMSTSGTSIGTSPASSSRPYQM